MKRYVQVEGVRKWAGDHLVELQSEPMQVFDRFFGQYNSYVLQGCEVTPAASDDLYDVAPGLVVLAGKDRTGSDTVMVVPFAGAPSSPLPIYLTLAWSVRRREYVTGGVKPIAYDYYATASTVESDAGTPYLLLNDKTPRFTDAIQDNLHRFLTAQQIADLEKSPRYRGAITAGNANDYRAYGVYNLNLESGATNFPAAGMKGVMIVSVADDQINQKITDVATGIFWERSLFGGVWSPWFQAMKNDFSNAEYDPSWHLFAQNGYWQSPDGLLIQWGRVVVSDHLVYFPKEFNQVWAVVGQFPISGTSGQSIYGFTTSYFGVSSGIAGELSYIAIGTWK